MVNHDSAQAGEEKHHSVNAAVSAEMIDAT
jgi:hypothetical protein